MSYLIQRKADGLFYTCRLNGVEVWLPVGTAHPVKSTQVYIAQLFPNLYKLTPLKK